MVCVSDGSEADGGTASFAAKGEAPSWPEGWKVASPNSGESWGHSCLSFSSDFRSLGFTDRGADVAATGAPDQMQNFWSLSILIPLESHMSARLLFALQKILFAGVCSVIGGKSPKTASVPICAKRRPMNRDPDNQPASAFWVCRSAVRVRHRFAISAATF
jgi:hypothetical protein